MTTDTFLFFKEHLGGVIAQKLNIALSDYESAKLYEDIIQLEGGIDDPERPPELASWKKWTVEELIEYARHGTLPTRPELKPSTTPVSTV